MTKWQLGSKPEEVVTEDAQEATRQQYELKVDPNAKLFRLGYTVEEAVNIVNT